METTSAIIGTNSDTVTKKRKTSSPPAELILLDNVINDTLSPRPLQASPISTVEDMESLFVIEERLTRSRRTTTTKIACEEEQQQRKKVKRTSSSPSPNTKIKPASCPPLLFMEELSNNLPSPYWNYTDGKPNRESSPPAKIKYPNTKMSFYEMNKRAKQILECVSKIQVEKPAVLDQQDFVLNRQRSLSTCSSSSSLSSASTVPLLDDYTNTCPSSPSTPIPFIPKQEESSLQILDRVTRELSKFQRKFGLLYQPPPQHFTRNSPAAAANKK